MPFHERELSGRVALVTGGSRGIGRAVAQQLARAGVKVAIGYRSAQAPAEQLCRSLADEGHRALAVGADVADPAALDDMVRTTEAGLGPVDILVSNAGSVHRRSLAELDTDTWDRTMHEHVRAAFVLARRTIPGMQARGWGRIVLMSSVAAFSGGIVGPHYTAAKAALIGLTHSLGAAFAKDGITANAIAPALIETDALVELGTPADLARRIPAGRLGRPDEVADLVMALVRNGFINGQTVGIDGGLHPR